MNPIELTLMWEHIVLVAYVFWAVVSVVVTLRAARC